MKQLEKKSDLIDVGLIFDDEGNPTDGFKVVSADSEEYQTADREWKVKNVRKTARRGRGVDAVTANGAAELVSMVEKRELALCFACIKEIYGFTKGEKPAELNEETLKEIFTLRPTWRVKVVTAIEAEQFFTKASSAPGAQ